MIDPNDLMLGNWLIHGESKCVQVTFLHRAHEINGLIADHFSPIPITVELIEKFGWKGIQSQWGTEYKIPPDLSSVLVLGSKGMVLVGPGYAIEKLRYVHELQNIYRWAVGKPLEIRL